MSRSTPVTQETAEKVSGHLNTCLAAEGKEIEESLEKLRSMLSEEGDTRTHAGVMMYMGRVQDFASHVQDVAMATLYTEGITTRQMVVLLADEDIEMSYQTVYRRVLRGMALAGVDPETMREEPKC